MASRLDRLNAVVDHLRRGLLYKAVAGEALSALPDLVAFVNAHREHLKARAVFQLAQTSPVRQPMLRLIALSQHVDETEDEVIQILGRLTAEVP